MYLLDPYVRRWSWLVLAFGLDLVTVRFVLRLKIEVLMGWTEKHLTAYCQHLHTERLLDINIT